MPGQAYNSLQNPRMYRALRKRGHSKESAARISNARTPGHTVKATRITGNLFRGESGKFQAGSGGDAAKPAEDTPKEDPKVKPDRAAERDAALAQEDEIRAAEDAAVEAEPNAKKRQAMRRANAVNRRKRSAERRAQDRANRETDRAERIAAQDAKRQAAEQAKLDKPAKEPKKGGGGGGGGSAKPKPSDDEKRQATLEKRQQTARTTASQVGLPSGSAELLTQARDQGGVTDARLSAMGLVGPDGLATDQGRRALGALERGDVGGFRAAVQDAQARMQREATARTRQQERDRRQAERDAPKEDKPDPKRRTSEAPVTDRREAIRARRRRNRLNRQPITKAIMDEITTKQDSQERAMFANMGGGSGGGGGGGSGKGGGGGASILWKPGPDGKRQPTRAQAEQHRLQAIGGARAKADDAKRAVDQARREHKKAEAALRKTDEDTPQSRAAMRELDRKYSALRKAQAKHDKAERDVREAKDISLSDYNIREKSAGNSFAVFKSTDGQDCWACITTSAYEDRDTEIITRKGLAFLVATAKATGNLGTLNYWHTPLVLGDCTFQALSDDGLFLIEAGTFRTKAAAELGRRMTAKGWRMSPGFYRPATEPYSAVVNGRRVGLYDHPTIFERSPCPPGRASNLYTPFIAKEARAVTEEQIRMLKSMAPEVADALLAQVETQKAQATQANAVFKGDTAETLPLLTDDTGQQYTVKAGKLVVLKAMPMVEAKADMPPAEMIEAGTTEVDDGLADEMDMGADEPLLSPGDIQAIAAAVLEAIGPMFDIQKQIGELKSALGGAMPAPKTKEADSVVTAPIVPVAVVETVKTVSPLEAIQAQMADLQKTIKELKGDQPEAATSRPTQSADTVVSTDNPLLANYKGIGVGDSPEEKVKAFLSGFPGFNGNGAFG
jgi:hypothetical protein